MSKKLFLNLGCGNKLYPRQHDWINVDVVQPTDQVEIVSFIDGKYSDSGNETPLFHNSDLKVMNFISDNCVDEIHAYHVIEHFATYEVLDVLKEWKRVLKPGGLVVLEQPDVLKCAAWLLAGAQTGEQQYEFNFGLLGFYGKQDANEPLMAHKWGYYPSSLQVVLEKAGFIKIRHDVAKTHGKHMRDFRIIGEKE
jgi:predicted SAM-dependent methyltransferase